MNTNLVYHSVNAEPQKADYGEFEVVDFFIKFKSFDYYSQFFSVQNILN